MEAIFYQIKDLYANADDAGRKEIQGYIRELQADFYTDWDVLMRLTSGPIQLGLIRIGIDLGLFQTLMQSKAPMSLSDLVSRTGASPQLLTRLLRTMAAFGQVKEVGKYVYGPSPFTRIFSEPNAAGTVCQLFDISGPNHTVFQKAFNTDLSLFEWMSQHPKHMESLGHMMALERFTHWVDEYPVQERLGSLITASGEPVLVDIGGGFGQQATAFRNKFPSLAGRVIVQDISSTLAVAKPVAGIEFMAHDFFNPQTVIGAKLYYLRHVLHDWPDAECVRILKNIIPAMGPALRLIIDEVVLPERGVPWQSAYMDLLMMNTLGGVERTMPEWEALLNQAGLEIVGVHQYDPKMQCVIVTVPK